MKKNNVNLNYLLQSKYNYTRLYFYPKILKLKYNVIIYYKQKQKYLLFINIILLFLFFNVNTKVRYIFKTNIINILELSIKNKNSILRFLNNFINIYFPLIDSFTAEFSFFSKKNIVLYSFFKFPLIFELNSLFSSLEYLYSFLNNYKFQIHLYLLKQRNVLINYNYLHLLKLPVLLK